MAKPMKDLGTQGGPAGVNTQRPRTSGVPSKGDAPMNQSFRGKQPSGTGSNDSKKAK